MYNSIYSNIYSNYASNIYHSTPTLHGIMWSSQNVRKLNTWENHAIFSDFMKRAENKARFSAGACSMWHLSRYSLNSQKLPGSYEQPGYEARHLWGFFPLEIAQSTLSLHTMATERLHSCLWATEPKLMGHFMHGPETKDLGPKNLRTKGLNTQGPKTDDSVTGNQRTWSLDVSLFLFFLRLTAPQVERKQWLECR